VQLRRASVTLITYCRDHERYSPMRLAIQAGTGLVMNTNTLRRVSVAAAIFCASLSIAVFALLLLVQHDSLAEAAKGAAPLAVFALCGAFGAAMTRYIPR